MLRRDPGAMPPLVRCLAGDGDLELHADDRVAVLGDVVHGECLAKARLRAGAVRPHLFQRRSPVWCHLGWAVGEDDLVRLVGVHTHADHPAHGREAPFVRRLVGLAVGDRDTKHEVVEVEALVLGGNNLGGALEPAAHHDRVASVVERFPHRLLGFVEETHQSFLGAARDEGGSLTRPARKAP
jgi:hypothetical protein